MYRQISRISFLCLLLFFTSCQHNDGQSRSSDIDRRVDNDSFQEQGKSQESSSIVSNNGEKNALVIGIGDYRHMSTLANPKNDAILVGNSLKTIDFNVETAIDTDHDKLQEIIEKYFNSINGSDLSVIYFAGHAFQIAGENYILPADFQIDSEQESDILQNLVSLDDLVTLTKQSGVQRTMIILDSCRNNPYIDVVEDKLSKAAGRSISVDPGLAEPATVRSATQEILFLYATAPGQIAFDGKDNNSPFATALAEWIVKPDVLLDDALRGLRRDVAALTKNRQVPFSTNNFSSRFRLNPRFEQLDSSVPADVTALAGTGRLTLRPQISIWLDQVVDKAKASLASNPEFNEVSYVAVSLSGANSHYRWCRQKLSARCDDLVLARSAVEGCQKGVAEGESCGLYAVIRNGVLNQIWQGQVVHFRGAQIPMAFNWEGLGLVAGLADYSSQGNGKVSFEIPAAGGHCAGTYEFTKPGVEGTFEAECENGLTLNANIARSKTALDVFQFSGSDSLGRKFEGVFNDDS